MAIITLTSDWGRRDHYTGAVKGAICRTFPQARIVDISHDIPAFDLNHAAFIVRNTYRDFPKGSVHIIALKGEASVNTPHTLVKYDDHYFIGADNGIFSLIFEGKPEKIIEIDIIQDSDFFTFPARDVFVKAACHVAAGKDPHELGPVKTSLVQRNPLQPMVTGDLIKGHVIYIDNYGNVFTNISQQLFQSVVKNRRFSITFRSTSYSISTISTSYLDVSAGDMLALFSSTGLLQIAIRDGQANTLLGLKYNHNVNIEIL